MKNTSTNKKYLFCCITIALGLVLYGLFNLKESTSLQVSLIHMEFNSSSDNIKSKSLNYKVLVNNNSSKPMDYQLIFARKDIENYPYLDSIPKEYISEMLSIKEKESKYLELKGIYLSNQDANTGGFYGNFEITIKYKN